MVNLALLVILFIEVVARRASFPDIFAEYCCTGYKFSSTYPTLAKLAKSVNKKSFVKGPG